MVKKRVLALVLCFFLFLLFPFAHADELFTQEIKVSDPGTYNIYVQSLAIPVKNVEISLDEKTSPFMVSVKAMQSTGPKDHITRSFVLREYFLYSYLNITSDVPLSAVQGMKVTLSIPKTFFNNYSYVPERLQLLKLYELDYATMGITLAGFDTTRENYLYEAVLPSFGLYAVALRQPEYNYLYLKRQSDFLFEDFSDRSFLSRFTTTGSWTPYLGALTYNLEERSSAAFGTEGNLSWTAYDVSAADRKVKRYYAVTGDANWSNYTFSTDVKAFSGEHRKIVFRYQNESNYYFLDLTTKGYVQLGKTVAGYDFPIASKTYYTGLEHWYSLKVTADGGHFLAFVDEELVVEAFDATPAWHTGKVGFMVDGGIHGLNYLFFDNARVYGYKVCKENCCPENMVACFEAERCVVAGSKNVGERYDCSFECVYDYGKEGVCGDAFSTELSIENRAGASSSLVVNLTNNVAELFAVTGTLSAKDGVNLTGPACSGSACALALDLLASSSQAVAYGVVCGRDVVHALITLDLSYTHKGEDVKITRTGYADCKHAVTQQATVEKLPEKGFFAKVGDFFRNLFS